MNVNGRYQYFSKIGWYFFGWRFRLSENEPEKLLINWKVIQRGRWTWWEGKKQVESSPKTAWKPSCFVCGLWRRPYEPPSNMRLRNRLGKPWCCCHENPGNFPAWPLLNMEDSHVPDSRQQNSFADLGQWWTMGRQCFWTIAMNHYHHCYHGYGYHYQNDTLFKMQLRLTFWNPEWNTTPFWKMTRDESELISPTLACAYLRQNFRW